MVDTPEIRTVEELRQQAMRLFDPLPSSARIIEANRSGVLIFSNVRLPSNKEAYDDPTLAVGSLAAELHPTDIVTLYKENVLAFKSRGIECGYVHPYVTDDASLFRLFCAVRSATAKLGFKGSVLVTRTLPDWWRYENMEETCGERNRDQKSGYR